MPKKLDPKVAEKVMLKAGLKPLEPYRKSTLAWKCMCLKCRSVVNAKYSNVSAGKNPCKACAYNQRKSGNKISNKDARIFMIQNGLRPLEPYVNNRTKWKSKCMTCGNIVFPQFGSIRSGRGGCKNCGKIKSGLPRRLDSKKALLIIQKAGMKPLEPYVNTRHKWKSKCLVCKKITYPQLTNIVSGHKACAYCSGKKVHENDAIKVMLKVNLKPLTKYKNNRTPWKSRCLKCKKIVYPIYNSITTGQGGCIYCAPYGINMNAPSYLYLITNKELNAHKVGIGNYKKVNDRLTKFKNSGWRVHKVWNFLTGEQALSNEKAIFRVIRKDLKLPIHLSKEQMPKTEGQSETINADSITLLELEKIIKKVIKGYRNNP
jgi:hypothetical protein